MQRPLGAVGQRNEDKILWRGGRTRVHCTFVPSHARSLVLRAHDRGNTWPKSPSFLS